jgi:hypothetical protein
VVEHLPDNAKALSSKPNTDKNKKSMGEEAITSHQSNASQKPQQDYFLTPVRMGNVNTTKDNKR